MAKDSVTDEASERCSAAKGLRELLLKQNTPDKKVGTGYWVRCAKDTEAKDYMRRIADFLDSAVSGFWYDKMAIPVPRGVMAQADYKALKELHFEFKDDSSDEHFISIADGYRRILEVMGQVKVAEFVLPGEVREGLIGLCEGIEAHYAPKTPAKTRSAR